MTTLAKFKEFHGNKISYVGSTQYAAIERIIHVTKARKGCFVVLFTLLSNGRACAEFWSSARKINREAYSYRSDESRTEQVKKWISRQVKHHEHTSKRDTAERGVEVGDVLSAAWGYDQTNYNYYQVTKLIGKTMVEVRELNQLRKETEWLQGKCAPSVDDFTGKPMRRVAKNGRVKICDVIRASKMSYEVVAGARVYNANHYTAYH